MAYEQRPMRRQKVRYNNANDDHPLVWQLVVDGAKVTPSAAPTITIYAPGNSTALVSAANMTLSSTVATYAPDTTTVASWPVDTGYRAHITTAYNSKTYEDDVIFDVAKFVLRLSIARDQLVALDDRIDGMHHAGDSDFSPIIEATRDQLQVLIETRVIEDGKLLESMILDSTHVEVPGRLLVLANIFRSKGDMETAAHYYEQFDRLWMATLAAIRYDQDQDLEEDGDIGGGAESVTLRY